ncbi:asparaginase, partial [Thioclava sp. BHET1]
HIHTDAVISWLADLGRSESDLRCGSHMPKDPEALKELTCSDSQPCQIHNNCSGKHAGFLTLNKHLRAGSEYIEIDHPIQRAVKDAFEDVTGESSPGYGIDGCSAPNFATTVTGLARSMAFFAGAREDGGAREKAAFRLTRAMMAYPEMVAGEGRACTELMRAMNGRAAIKTGAEAVFIGILPEKKLGIALKIVDGGTRASEAAIAALLVRHGVLEAGHPATSTFLNTVQKSWRGIETGILKTADGFV